MEIQRNKSNKSTNVVSDTESEASESESFHSYDSPPPSLPKLPPPPGYPTDRVPTGAGYDVATDRVPTRADATVGVRPTRPEMAIGVRRISPRGVMLKRAELGFRVCQVAFCLVSLSMMVSDKTKGWAGDSYYRYKEYRFCAAVNAIGLVYSGLQACDLTLGLIRGNNFNYSRLRYQFNFATDQIIAYLLISASSSGASRVNDWISNWGKDEFTELASTSIVVSFLAFAAFAFSCLISGSRLFK